MSNPVIPIKPPYTPELLKVVQMVIYSILHDKGFLNVFEIGSGFSTLWFAEFSNVISVEHDPLWHEEVTRALEHSRLDARYGSQTNGATVLLVPEVEIPNAINDYGKFDIVLVDCVDAQRNEAARKAMPHVKPGGWLLLDDSQWPMLGQAEKDIERLAGDDCQRAALTAHGHPARPPNQFLPEARKCIS